MGDSDAISAQRRLLSQISEVLIFLAVFAFLWPYFHIERRFLRQLLVLLGSCFWLLFPVLLLFYLVAVQIRIVHCSLLKPLLDQTVIDKTAVNISHKILLALLPVLNCTCAILLRKVWNSVRGLCQSFSSGKGDNPADVIEPATRPPAQAAAAAAGGRGGGLGTQRMVRDVATSARLPVDAREVWTYSIPFVRSADGWSVLEEAQYKTISD